MHTLGPWTIGELNSDAAQGPPGEIAIMAGAVAVAVAIPTGENGDLLPGVTRANAELIASAPTMRLHNVALTDALRKVAVFHRYRPAEDGGTVFMGAGCEICDAECGPEQQIVHVGDCPLTVLNPQN